MADGVENQAKQALTNMGHILKEAGGSYEHVVKTTILLNDINDFANVNNVFIYSGWWIIRTRCQDNHSP
ncbi:hypothetical protein WDU94_002771 [Cyamophila willieti]